jgi:hypothetical protein
MELDPTISKLENQAAKYISAANELRALAGMPERGQLTFESVADDGAAPGGTAPGQEDTDVSAKASRSDARAKASKGKSDKKEKSDKRAARSSSLASQWTPERRAAQAEMMRQRHSRKKETASEDDTTMEPEPQTGEAELQEGQQSMEG